MCFADAVVRRRVCGVDDERTTALDVVEDDVLVFISALGIVPPGTFDADVLDPIPAAQV